MLIFLWFVYGYLLKRIDINQWRLWQIHLELRPM